MAIRSDYIDCDSPANYRLDWPMNRRAVLNAFPPLIHKMPLMHIPIKRQIITHPQKLCVYVQVLLFQVWRQRTGTGLVRWNIVVKRWRCGRLGRSTARLWIAEWNVSRNHRHWRQLRCLWISNESGRLGRITVATSTAPSAEIIAIREIDQHTGR